jgi:hypothetical protein
MGFCSNSLPDRQCRISMTRLPLESAEIQKDAAFGTGFFSES